MRENAVAAAFRDPRFAPLARRGTAGHARRSVAADAAPSRMSFGDEADALAQLRPNVDGVILDATAASARPSCRRSGRACRTRGSSWPTSSARRACRRISGTTDVMLARYQRDQVEGAGGGMGSVTESASPGALVARAATTAASSATCARATAACTRASAAPASCARWTAARMVLTTYGRSSGFCIDPDREEAAQPLLSRQQRALLRHRRLQPGLQVLPELGHLASRARWTR
ncbi:MAG: hypothetical protein MZW92_50065 [Comamonadaceae bacterium]|nr:hypothetical protein [Comamonadaceae bacterium]